MTVLCFNDPEEVENAIRYHDNDLAVIREYGDPVVVRELWHPDWDDVEDGHFFVKAAHQIGLDDCSYYVSERMAAHVASERVLRNELRRHANGYMDDDVLLQNLSWFGAELISAGYVTFHQFSHKFAAVVAVALDEMVSYEPGAQKTVDLVRNGMRDICIQAALSEELDERIVRMCDPLSVIRSAQIPELGQHAEIAPSWQGILFDDFPVT